MYDQLTAFQRDILYIVMNKDEPHGLAIKEELDEYYTGEVNHGRLYPNLDDLVEDGLLEKGSIDRRTNKYMITEKGRKMIRERREWENRRID